ncbi:MAG TPA: hypothetical protein VGS06_01570 [Streptosporangiaceae bacterium]|nr:hypothetical protein [Streptosporangiaceae bacterium]
MRAWLAPLMLAAARGRRRPARWLLPALGMALAAAFVAGVAAQAQIAGDQSARSVLAGVSPLDSQARVTWQGPVSPSVTDQARALLRGLGLGSPTEVLLMNPVRLTGVVVRPAAISSLGRWLPGALPGRLGPCRPENCPMLLVGGGPPPQVPSALTAIGVRIQVVGSSPLRSAVPLGFAPSSGDAGPVLVTWDVAGLDALPGLSGLYRTHSWLAPLTITGLRWWQLAGVEDRLQRSQARLLLSGSQFSLSAPFTALDQARAEASVAPQRLLLAGGGALTALALFIVLAGGGLRRDQGAELDRLRNAGARTRQCVLFVATESGWLCAAALIVGTVAGIGAAALLAASQGEPAGAILTHAVITRAGAITLGAGWLAATVLLGTLVLVRTARLTDLLAVGAASALVAALAAGTGSDQALTLLLAPLCCAAAGVLTFRAARLVLRGAERVARRGPVLPRLALLNLARSPGVTALAIAFIAVATGLGGFALAYRSTLIRSAADQAADQVPLDVLVSPGPDFHTPLEVAPLQRWQALASGAVLPVRRTDANYTTGGGTVTVPALGIPAGGLTAIHGWRASDGSASLATLARRLEPAGPVRAPGPTLPADAQSLSLRASAQGFAVTVTADLRDPQGAIRQVTFGTVGASAAVLRVPVPPGRWELEALELDEPTGLAITNGHQNGENAGAATQASASVALGPLFVLPAGGPSLPVPLGAWRGAGAAATTGSATTGPATTGPAAGGAVAMVGFSASGTPGVLRPAQPTDTLPVPVLVDPQTAASAGPDGRIALTVDGLPVVARVAGVLSRFPTLGGEEAGFVIADEATLAAALDAQLPGQGRPDELWISSAHPAQLHAALDSGTLAQLDSSFRGDIDQQLRDAPVARGVLGTLIAATALSVVLAVVGLLTALLGGARDKRAESDLTEQGVGPHGLRAELRVRLALASVLGVIVGLGIAVLLTRLAVASVRAAGTVADPSPPVVTVVPWPALAAWGAGTLAVLTLADALATRALIGSAVR